MMQALLKFVVLLVALLVVLLVIVGCPETFKVAIVDDQTRDHYAVRGWVPAQVPLGSMLTYDLDTNRCTIHLGTEAKAVPGLVDALGEAWTVAADGRSLVCRAGPMS